jgi:hypothetical protein
MICGTAKVVMTAVVYDQNTDHAIVGSRRAGEAISVGKTKHLSVVSVGAVLIWPMGPDLQ